jgi:small subunit ribosomal protein S6
MDRAAGSLPGHNSNLLSGRDLASPIRRAPGDPARGPQEVPAVRPYEVMIIFDADLEEETIRSAVARYTELIESRGAARGPVDFWGKRRFAYELKHRWEGYYVVFQAKAEPAAMDELHRSLSLADEVLRHKILRIPEHVYGNLAGSAASDN